MNYPLIKKLPIFLSFIFLICMVPACQLRKLSADLSTIELYYVLDMVSPEGLVIKTKGEINISYYRGCIMLSVPYISTHKNTLLDQSADIKDEKIESDTLYNFYLYRKNDSSGTFFKSLDTLKGAAFSVDSLLKQKAFKGGTYYDNKLDSLVSQDKLKDDLESKVLKYAHKNSPLTKAYDSLFIYSSTKLSHIDFSLSDALDIKSTGKVYKIMFIFNKTTDTVQESVVPERKYIFGFKPIEIKQPEKVLKLFKRYIKNQE